MIRDLAHVVDSENARIAEPRRRNDPCPCGSGRRYKHCHGSKVATTNDPMPNEMQNANDDFFEDAESVVTAFEGGPVPISTRRLNIRRGLLRTWIVISAIWICSSVLVAGPNCQKLLSLLNLLQTWERWRSLRDRMHAGRHATPTTPTPSCRVQRVQLHW